MYTELNYSRMLLLCYTFLFRELDPIINYLNIIIIHFTVLPTCFIIIVHFDLLSRIRVMLYGWMPKCAIIYVSNDFIR